MYLPHTDSLPVRVIVAAKFENLRYILQRYRNFVVLTKKIIFVSVKKFLTDAEHCLFGAPGCGKGTQAARLKEKYGIDHVSTGNVIREEIARGTKLGKEMESYITTGRLAPDQVVIDMIADYIAAHKHAKGNIFDGFPRTTHQAEEFDRMLSEQGLKVDVMIYMDVPEEELVKRILLRGKESGRADDASEEVIRDRIKVYHEQTAIVADFYAKQGKFADINGLGTMDEVFDRICQVIDSIRK